MSFKVKYETILNCIKNGGFLDSKMVQTIGAGQKDLSYRDDPITSTITRGELGVNMGQIINKTLAW